MTNIIYTKEALVNLSDIAEYYLAEFGQVTANKVINAILNRIEILVIFPKSGSKTPSSTLNEEGYKKLVINNHVIIYLYKKHENTAYIYHIYRDRQNY